MLELSDMRDLESTKQFESRKADHIRVAMDPIVQATGSGFDAWTFVHEALPEIDFIDVSIATAFLGGRIQQASPFFVSSMTAGHVDSIALNERLAKVAAACGWAMGVGSQRRELFDADASAEWTKIRRAAPGVALFGNIGLSQLIHTKTDDVRRLADSLEAKAMIVHLNPLQEVLQVEGTPRFRGGLDAIARLARELSVPVIVKETGCGISGATAKKLFEAGAAVIDVAGRGGTHWGRIEGQRAAEGRAALLAEAAISLRDWGLSTVESLCQVVRVCDVVKTREEGAPEVWASGGVRSGLDGAKALALGASAVGVAQPLMKAALEGEEALHLAMTRFDYELKTVLFCQGAQTITELRARGGLVRSSDGAVSRGYDSAVSRDEEGGTI